MTRQELNELLQDSSRLDAGRLHDLISLSAQYPYCGAFHRLILIALHQSGDLRYASELHKRILSIPNPEELFLTLRKTGSDLSPISERDDAEAPIETAGGDAFDIIEDFLEEHPDDTSEIESLLGPEESAPQAHNTPEAESQSQESTSDIVTAFLSQGPEAEVIRPIKEKETSDLSSEKKETLAEDDYLTETLARIYIRQGKYDRALRIFRSLNLKYPKKSGYFAEQIAYLERAINLLGTFRAQ